MATGAIAQATPPAPYKHGEIGIGTGEKLTLAQVNRLLGANIIKGEHGFSSYKDAGEIDADFSKMAATQAEWDKTYGSDPSNSGLNQEGIHKPGSMTVLLPGGRGQEVAYAQIVRDPKTGEYSFGETGGHTSVQDALKGRVYKPDGDLLGVIDQGLNVAAKALPTIVGTYLGGPLGGSLANAAVEGKLDPEQMAKSYALSWAGGQVGDWAKGLNLGDTATGALKGFVGSGGNPLGAITGAAGGALKDFDFMSEDAKQLSAQGLSQSQISDILGQEYGDSWTNYLAQASGAVQDYTKGLVNPTKIAVNAGKGAVTEALGLGGGKGGGGSTTTKPGGTTTAGGGDSGLTGALALASLLSQQPKAEEEDDTMSTVENTLARMQEQGMQGDYYGTV